MTAGRAIAGTTRPAGAPPGQEPPIRQQSPSSGGGMPSRSRMDTYLSPVSFWWPEYLEGSAWLDHAPFAFWLLEAHRPRSETR